MRLDAELRDTHANIDLRSPNESFGFIIADHTKMVFNRRNTDMVYL